MSIQTIKETLLFCECTLAHKNILLHLISLKWKIFLLKLKDHIDWGVSKVTLTSALGLLLVVLGRSYAARDHRNNDS